MSVTAEQQALIDQHVASFHEERIYQQGVVAEVQKAGGILKKAKTEILPRIITLTNYRLFIFNVLEKKFLEKKGKHLIEIKYLDLTGMDTDGKKLTFQFEIGGQTQEHIIRTDQLKELVYYIRLQRRKHIPYAPFPIVAPSELVPSLEEYKAASKTGPYLDSYTAWCNYFQVPVNQPFIYWVENLEVKKAVDFDLRECPGIETSGPLSLNVTPILLALKFDTYFKSLTVTKVARKEVMPLVAEICKGNHALTKLVVVETEGDSNSFVDVGTALKKNSQISLQIVDISMNKFTDKGLASFASALTSWHCRLTHLKLNNCNFGGKGLEQLFQAFQMNFSMSLGLVYLNLHGNKIDDSAGLVLDSWIDRADEYAHLETLILSATNIGVQYLSKLRNFRKLATFDYSENPLTSQNLRQLSGIFEYTASITNVNLALCGLTSAVVESFLPTLTKIKTNVSVNLVGNPIGQTATEFKGIARYLREFQQLTGLDFSAVPFKETALPDLFDSLKALPALKEIIFDGIKAKPEAKDALNVLLAYPALTKLSMAGSFSRDSIASFISQSRQGSRLSYLDVSGTYYGDELAPIFVEYLRHDKVLSTFKCEGAGFSISGWQLLYTAIRIHPTIKVMTNPTFELTSVRGISDLSPSAADSVWRRAVALNYEATQYWYLRQKLAEGSFHLGEHPFASQLTTPLTPAQPVAVPSHLPSKTDMSLSSIDSIADENSPSVPPLLQRTASRAFTAPAPAAAADEPEESEESEATSEDASPVSSPPTTRPPPPSFRPPPPTATLSPPTSTPPPPSSKPPPPSSHPPPPSTLPPPPTSQPPPPAPVNNSIFEFDDPDNPTTPATPPPSASPKNPRLSQALPKVPLTRPPSVSSIKGPPPEAPSSPRGRPPSEAPSSPGMEGRPLPPDRPMPGAESPMPGLARAQSSIAVSTGQPKSPALQRQASVSGAPNSPLPAPPKKQPPAPPPKASPPPPGAY